ncbi:nuclear transport factor 2 family protein [Streptomyces sp. NBC_01013]|uniref:nuclear transport factor 2 family protein n=1 Tax=Streptomyces sp. NBC_01013 TaxID=2903718 RepID=UPI0038633659|nr:nuclear transport factor 2 family protein [Streptomyces sp. NBC_01013]
MHVTVHPPDQQVATELHAIEHRRQRALVDADLDALDEIFDDTLVYTHAHGLTHTKTQLLEFTAARRPYLGITRGELHMRLVSEVAVVTGPLTNLLRTPDGGERTLAGLATQILYHHDRGGWRFISFQMTPFSEQK